MALRRAAVVAALVALTGNARAAEPQDALVRYRVVGDGIPVPLTSVPGDPRQGRVVLANSDRGNCLICHHAPIAEVSVFGDVGPPLDGVGARLSEAQLRLRLVDARRFNPASIMPAYYKVGGLYRVAPRYRGRPMLSAQEIEDVLAYLRSLR
jgi:sulfur-oxidizing protein SoxX